MKMKKTIFLTILLGLLLTNTVFAALTMNVTDAGNGNSRFVFSGAANVIADGTSNYNSFWIFPGFAGGGWQVGFAGCTSSLISGSGSTSSSGSPSGGAVYDVCLDSGGLAPRSSPSPSQLPGNAISWSGDLVAAIPFSQFVPGVYASNVIGYSDGGSYRATLDSDYILTIGDAPVLPIATSVPTLSIWGMMLMGLLLVGLTGLVIRRGRT